MKGEGEEEERGRGGRRGEVKGEGGGGEVERGRGGRRGGREGKGGRERWGGEGQVNDYSEFKPSLPHNIPSLPGMSRVSEMSRVSSPTNTTHRDTATSSPSLASYTCSWNTNLTSDESTITTDTERDDI